MRIFVFGGWIALGGCSSNNEACLDYTDVYAGCVQEAEDAGLPVDVDVSDPDGFCEELGDGFTDEQWDCQAKAYADGDCTTEQGLADALTVADAC